MIGGEPLSIGMLCDVGARHCKISSRGAPRTRTADWDVPFELTFCNL